MTIGVRSVGNNVDSAEFIFVYPNAAITTTEWHQIYVFILSDALTGNS